MADSKKRILILGGGFGGAYAAQILSRKLPEGYELTVVDRNNFLLFYPLLVEAGVGVLEPRHVVVPIRRFMPGSDFRMAEVIGIDTKNCKVEIQGVGSTEREILRYDHLVFGLGSITRIPPIPGLTEYGFQLKSLTDAIALRDRGIRLLEQANTYESPEARRSLLRIIVVGANFTGIELAGEYQSFLVHAARQYPNVSPSEIEVRVLELGDRILPAVEKTLAAWARTTLEKRGVVIQTENSVSEVGKDFAVLKSGERLETQTVVWAAGIAPNPIVQKCPAFPTNTKGYIECGRDLRVKGFENVWAIGDAAAVSDDTGRPYPATAQVASRQGPLVAKNILSVVTGHPTKEIHFKPLGSFAIIGNRNATAEFMGLKFRKFAGWFLYRGAYLAKMPTFTMKVRLAMDWFLELVLPAEIVQLGVHRDK